MDIYQDEVRREAVAIQREHRAVMGRWKSLLSQVFDPDHRKPIPGVQKAALLGVPSRRQFLKVGGITVAGSAILVASGEAADQSSTTTSAAGVR